MNRNEKGNGKGTSPKRIALVDDDPAVLASLEAGLGDNFDIVAKCASGEEVLASLTQLPARCMPHVVLLDIKMPGLDGIACCRELRKCFPELVIAMHTAKAVRERFEEARLAGADAYLVKGSLPPAQLVTTLLQLTRTERKCLCVGGGQPANQDWPPARTPSALLTEMDLQVMELLREGMTIKEMSANLSRHEQTVKKHLASIRRKLRVRTNAQALAELLGERKGGLQK